AFALSLFVLTMPLTHAAAQGNEIWQEKAYLPGMSAIALGILAAMLVRRFPRVKKWQSLALVLAGVAGIGLIFFAGSAVWHLIGEGYLLMLTLSAAILLLGLHWREQGPTSRRWRAFAWLESCGRWSYEIYLTHMFCVFAVVGLAKLWGTSAEWSFAWYVPAIGSAWLLGYAVARWFSDPCEKFLRRRFRAPRTMTDDVLVASDLACSTDPMNPLRGLRRGLPIRDNDR
ncbi:MAG: acyltransferase family protein, partial [Tahibacter sp.]